MATSIKTVKLPLVTPQPEVCGELDRVFCDFRWVYDETAKRLPSLPKRRIRKAKDPVYYYWVKEFRGDVDLPAQVAQEAVQKARESYASMLSNKVFNEIPRSSSNVARFHNQCFSFERVGDYYFLNLPVKGGRRNNRILLPVRKNNYSHCFLEEIAEGKSSYGAGELKRHSGVYWFNLPMKENVEVHDPSTPIGVDFGIRNLAVACAYSRERLHVRLWNGKKAQHKRRHFLNRIGELSRRGLLTHVRRTKGKYRRYMQGQNHIVSKGVVDFAQQFFQPFIILEELHKFRKENDWTFYELRKMIEYKALERGIPVVMVNPKNTSNRCNRCGFTLPENRNGMNFRCLRCYYQVNADVNAAINLSKFHT